MSLKKLLIIEDEPTCQIMLTQALAPKYHTQLAATLARAKELLLKDRPDLILLDFYLPDGDAFEMIRFIKNVDSLSDLPIILITQESKVQIKVQSFAEGIYDFVTKPYDMDELLARIDSHLSRSAELKSSNYKSEKVGDLELDSEAQSVSSIKNGHLKLSPIEFKILQCLMHNAGKVRTREQLAMAVWKRKFFQSRTLDRHISSIRKKLGDNASYLQTVSQGGYRLANTDETTSESLKNEAGTV